VIRRVAAPAFVWGVWLASLASTARAVWTTARNVPVLDQWWLVPAYAGQRPATLAWLFERQSEHRLPLVRGTLHLAHALTHDFRAPIFLSLALYAFVSAAGIAAARALRGRTAATDAVFPLALLHPGHLCMRSGFDLCFALPASVYLAAVFACAAPRARGEGGVALALGLASAALAPCGGAGLVLAAPLAALAALLALRRFRDDRRPVSLAPLVGLVSTLAMAASFAIGWRRDPAFPPASGPIAVLRAAVEFAGQAAGPSATVWPLTAIAIPALAAWTAVTLVRSLRREPAGRTVAAALCAALAAFGALCVAVGWGRGGVGPGAGRWPQYSTIAAILPCAIGIAWIRFETAIGGATARWATLAVVAAALPGNWQVGLIEGRRMRAESVAIERDAWLGATSAEIASDPPLRDGRLFGPLVEALRAGGEPPFDRGEAERDRRLRPFYESLSMFRTTPTRIRSSGRVRPKRCGGLAALEVGPRSQIRFAVGPGTWIVSGRFGLCAEGPSVRFQGDGPAIAFLDQTADRAGLAPFHATFVAARAADVVLRTSSEGGRGAWTEIRLAPAPSEQQRAGEQAHRQDHPQPGPEPVGQEEQVRDGGRVRAAARVEARRSEDEQRPDVRQGVHRGLRAEQVHDEGRRRGRRLPCERREHEPHGGHGDDPEEVSHPQHGRDHRRGAEREEHDARGPLAATEDEQHRAGEARAHVARRGDEPERDPPAVAGVQRDAARVGADLHVEEVAAREERRGAVTQLVHPRREDPQRIQDVWSVRHVPQDDGRRGGQQQQGGRTSHRCKRLAASLVGCPRPEV
jgi:hypothetical protein